MTDSTPRTKLTIAVLVLTFAPFIASTLSAFYCGSEGVIASITAFGSMLLKGVVPETAPL
jgi:hypothetical protein